MRRTLSLAIGTASLLLAVAPAAHAAAVPFSVHYDIDEQGFEAGVEQSADSEFIGFCGEDTCTGVRLTAGIAPVTGGTSAAKVALSGYLCVADSAPPCSPGGTPFTGVLFTEAVVDAPEAHADAVFVDVSLCRWSGLNPNCIETAGDRLYVGEIEGFPETGPVRELGT